MSISTIFIPKGYKAVEIFKSNNPDDIGEALRQ